ncbi:MAG TPA: ABC transporter permease [bacterium]|nr:ABC transporter permease [bacterium]
MSTQSRVMKSLTVNNVAWLGEKVNNFVVAMGEIALMTFWAFVNFFSPPWRLDKLKEFFWQCYDVAIKSLPIAVITAFFTGGVMALQLTYSLSRFGLKSYVGTMVSMSVVRELAPVLTCLLVGGRVGAGMCAEIGSMTLTEQIDAMRSLGADPLVKLVAPRLLACILMFPLLTLLADIVGLWGGMLVVRQEAQLDASFYWHSIRTYMWWQDYAVGIFKTFFFGYAVAIIGCYQGLKVVGGAEGLGRAVTFTVVLGLIAILISDYFLSKVFLLWLIYGAAAQQQAAVDLIRAVIG